MLKRLRDETGKSQAEAARAIGKDQARISRVELGRGSLSGNELARLLDFLDVNGDERETALSLGAQTRRRQRTHAYTDVLPGSFQRLADLEADATEIRSYESGIIPGLLQSPDYLRALLEAGDGVWWEASEREIDSRVEFRLTRQHRVLGGEPSKTMFFVLGEETLRVSVGGPSVMRRQILHLLQIIESQANTMFQVMPVDTPQNPLLGGGIIVLDFEDAPRIGFVTSVYGPAVYHDQEHETSALLRAFQRTQELALSSQNSRDLLIRYLKEY